MFAYCNNNPVNHVDSSGMRPVLFNDDPYAEVYQNIGKEIGEQLKKHYEEFKNRYNKVEQMRAENSTPEFIDTYYGGQVQNSYMITDWAEIYMYCCNLKGKYPDKFKGTPEGMTIEWIGHNAACYLPSASLDKAMHVDFKETIFDNDSSFSFLMYGVYSLLFPELYEQELQIWLS